MKNLIIDTATDKIFLKIINNNKEYNIKHDNSRENFDELVNIIFNFLYQNNINLKELIEAGVHFGHKSQRWNPKMSKFIHSTRENIHIINLNHTVQMLSDALTVIDNITSKGGKILFVATKKQAANKIADLANETNQYYVNHRWLGGMLTNWETVSKSIKRLKDLESKIETGEINNLTKKEKLNIERSKEKLELNLGGIKNMPGLPDAIFVIDINKESIAVQEAKKLNIPVVAICDTNTDPNNIDYPVPGNDDAVRSISLYCDLIGSAILSGMEENLAESGVDIGNSEVNADEKIPSDQEIEALENAVEKEINQNQNGENFDNDLEDNSNSNEK